MEALHFTQITHQLTISLRRTSIQKMVQTRSLFLRMIKLFILANARMKCVHWRRFLRASLKLTETAMTCMGMLESSSSNSFLSMRAPSVRESLSNIARKDASNKTGLKSINSSALVKCQKLVTQSFLVMSRELKHLPLLSKKRMMKTVLLQSNLV